MKRYRVTIIRMVNARNIQEAAAVGVGQLMFADVIECGVEALDNSEGATIKCAMIDAVTKDDLEKIMTAIAPTEGKAN